MKFYEVTYIVEDEENERLSKLAERYGKINGWNEKEISQVYYLFFKHEILSVLSARFGF